MSEANKYSELFLGKLKKLFVKKSFLGLTLILLFFLFASVYLSLNQFYKKDVVENTKEQQAQSQQTESNQQVLGRNIRAPQIYIYGGEHKYSSGGIIALASTDEPAIQIGGYNISGQAEIAMYEANEDVLLDYLTHDKDGKQTKRAPDLNKIQYVTTVKQDIKHDQLSRSF